MLTETLHILDSHAPAADRYNANPAGDYINARFFEKISFLLFQATAGTNTGTAVVTVNAATVAAGTSAEAVPFRYRKKTTGASSAWGAITDATASGFTTTANEVTIYEIEVDATSLPDGKPYVSLQLTEGTNDPVTAAVVAIGVTPRFQATVMPDPLA